MWKRELIENKIYGLLIVGIGILTIFISYDLTAFILTAMFGVPIFFSKENVILKERGTYDGYRKSRY